MTSRLTVTAAFSEYESWWKRRSAPLAERGLRRGLLPGDFSFSFERYGMRLGVVGLNSAFLHLSDAVPKVHVGLKQFNDACGGSGASGP